MEGCLGKGWNCYINGDRFEINQLLFADDTALVADSEKLCRLVSECGRVYWGTMDDSSFFDCLSQFCFLLIEFHCTFSISYKILHIMFILIW